MVKVAACLPRKGSTPELCGMCVNLMRHLMRSHLMKMRISIRSSPCPCEERVMVTLRAIMHLTYKGRPAGSRQRAYQRAASACGRRDDGAPNRGTKKVGVRGGGRIDFLSYFDLPTGR